MTYAMLAWYGPETLDEVAGHLSLDPSFEAADDVTFRDTAGRWWRPQRDGSWLVHDVTGWHRAARPESLEGVAPLPMGIAATTGSASLSVQSEPSDDVGALAGLVRCVDRVGRAYRTGEVVSTMAELVLSDWMLLTRDGRLWTVGVQSRFWYTYGGHEWVRVDGPPEGPFLLGADAEALVRDVASSAHTWAEQGPHLPESVSPEWLAPDPPESFVPPPLPPIDEPAPR